MDIKIHKMKLLYEDRVKAVFSFVIDKQLAVHDVKLIETNNKLFLAMPNKMIGGNWRDIVHPIGSALRMQMEAMAIKEYKKQLEE